MTLLNLKDLVMIVKYLVTKSEAKPGSVEEIPLKEVAERGEEERRLMLKLLNFPWTHVWITDISNMLHRWKT